MPNRLANETSPYLLQHAHNPVLWWPWSDEAFEEAKRRGVPVFLSIGYSTCYWCHVMERESFEDAATAAVLNENFVPIKVDREERPDVDEVYMASTVIMTGHGGWPMSVFLEPEKRRPFWCGTYFPKMPRAGMPTFTQVLQAISKAYREQPEAIEQQAEELSKAVSEQVSGTSATAQLGQDQVSDAVGALLKIFDRADGGFGSAPKFPQPVFLEFLLDTRARAADDSTSDALDIAIRLTLDKMASGGLFDQVGGGFHRYSVDGLWTVPHFEKMLYDNAQLARVYARAARYYGDAWYEQVTRRTLEYITREMTNAYGAFCSAQDAEVDGREGFNYLWTPEELREALEDDDAEFAISVYGLAQGANFIDPHHREERARNVLRLEDRPERLAPKYNLSLEAFDERLARIAETLYSVRQQRTQPRMDDKVLTAWNGLMIGAFATAARELGDDSLLEPAEKAAAFILSKLTDSDGEGGERRLLRVFRAGEAKTPGFLEDHAFLLSGLLELARATTGQRRELHLQQAIAVLSLADASFEDVATGAWFDTRDDQTDIFVRARATHDGALPSGVSVMLHNLLDLAELTGEAAYRDRALKSLIAISSAVAETPVGSINSTRALLRMLVAEPQEVATRLQAIPNIARAGTAFGASGGQVGVDAVEVYASTDRVSVADGLPAELTLFVKVRDGYHVPAADPGSSATARALVPFRVGLHNGNGVAVYAGYPEGEAYGEGTRVYTGSFELQVALERSGDWKGRPLITVMYQACTDTECLAPQTLELDIAIDRG